MSDERSFPESVGEATAWTGDPEPEPPSSRSSTYRCVDCAWTGRTLAAASHHTQTGHAVRGRDWPASWPNAQFPDADTSGRRRTNRGTDAA